MTLRPLYVNEPYPFVDHTFPKLTSYFDIQGLRISSENEHARANQYFWEKTNIAPPTNLDNNK